MNTNQPTTTQPTTTLAQLRALAERGEQLAPPEIGGIFHAHLTVTVDAEQLPALRELCRRQGVKLTIVDLENETRQQRDVMTTSYYRETAPGSVGRIIEQLGALATVLEEHDYPVVRAKLEHETRPTVTRFSRAQYHEVHIKLAIPADRFEARRRELATMAQTLGFVASSNPRERKSGLVMQFVNLRIYDGDQAAADRRVRELVEHLEAADFTVRETKQETVIFDTHLELDAWWA